MYLTTFKELYENVDTRDLVKDYLKNLEQYAKTEEQKKVFEEISSFYDNDFPTLNDIISKFSVIKEQTLPNINIDVNKVLDELKKQGIDLNNILTSQNLLVALYGAIMMFDKTGLTTWPLIATSYINYQKDPNPANLLILTLTTLSGLPLGLGSGLIKTAIGLVSMVPGVGWIAGLLLAPIALASGPLLSLAPLFALLKAPSAIAGSNIPSSISSVQPMDILTTIATEAKKYYDQAMNFLSKSGVGPALSSMGSTLMTGLSNIHAKAMKQAEEDPLFSTKDKEGFWERMSKQKTPTQYGGFRFPRGKSG